MVQGIEVMHIPKPPPARRSAKLVKPAPALTEEPLIFESVDENYFWDKVFLARMSLVSYPDHVGIAESADEAVKLRRKRQPKSLTD